MFNLLEKILQRGGIKDITQLTPDEKITYDQLVKDLEVRAKPVSSQDWEEFLQDQLDKTIESFNPDSSEKKKEFLWAQIYLLQKLLVFLKRPAREEENIKKENNL